MLRNRLTTCAAPVAVTMLALAVRLHGLGDKPFWLDEILTLLRSRLPLGDLVADALRNMHYPTYFLLLSPFAEADHAEWVLRAPSALFGALCAGLACAIAQAAKNGSAGLVAGLLTALSPFQVQFSQEARSYALVAALVLLALWGLMRIAAAADRSEPPAMTPASRLPWIAYIGGTILALVVHSSAIMWLLAANFAALAITLRRRRQRAELVRAWLLAQGLVIGCWLPALLLVLPYMARTAVGDYWIPPATAASIWTATKAVYLFRVSDSVMYELGPGTVPGLGALVALQALIGMWQLRRQPAAALVLLLALLVLPAGLLIASIYKPLFLPRYLLWTAPPLFVLAGIGLGSAPRPVAALAVPILGVVLAWNLWPYYTFESKPRWDLAARYIAAEARPGDVVLLRSFPERLIYRVYRDRFGPPLDAVPRVLEASEAAAALENGFRAWALSGRTGFGPLPTAAAYLQELDILGRPGRTRQFGAHVTVFRFDPKGG